jgi:hypothetical protein
VQARQSLSSALICADIIGLDCDVTMTSFTYYIINIVVRISVQYMIQDSNIHTVVFNFEHDHIWVFGIKTSYFNNYLKH